MNAKRPNKRNGRSGEVSPRAQDDLWLPLSPDVADGQNVAAPLDALKPPQVKDFGNPDAIQAFRFRVFDKISSPLDGLIAALAQERERGAAFLWAPVFFGLGCLLYFSLPREPLTWAFPTLAVLAAGLAWKTGRENLICGVLVAVCLLAAGVSVGQFRSSWVDTHMLPKSGIAEITGRVVQAEYRWNGSARYTLDMAGEKAALKMRGVTDLPGKIRLTARKGAPKVRVGALMTGRARLGPPPGPSFPGSYDFSFQAWFKGIGGSGYFLGHPKVVLEEAAAAWSLSLSLSKMRANITAIIRNVLPGTYGGLAAALIVGDRSGIDDQTADRLRRSGLAHILAISGLHMALVAATVIFVLRAAFALFPAVALHYPTRKWSCSLALVATSVYLALSGASVSAQRAYIMIAIMLLAVLCDRRALTMRNVAVAAFVVLLLSPEALLSPGFQMSFAAVAALVATYERVSKQMRGRKKPFRNGLMGKAERFFVRDVGGLALTSLVAGIATSLFAAFHFYRVAPFGLLANVLAMPLVTFAVMPLALLSVLAMPFALEAVPLALMAKAMSGVLSIAQWVASAGPGGDIGFIPVTALAFGTCGLLVATLSRTGLKWFSLPLFLIAGLAYFVRTSPDILVLENGRQIAVVDRGQGMSLLRPNAEKFSTKIWQQAYDPSKLGGDQNIEKKKLARGRAGPGYRCDPFGCSIVAKGLTITHLSKTGRLFEDCRMSDVIIAPYDLAGACTLLPLKERPIIIDRQRLARYGAQSLYIEANGGTAQGADAKIFKDKSAIIRIKNAHSAGPRPWTRHRFKAD